MIYGQLNATTGELTNLSDRPPTNADDVPLASMPGFFGPYGYDAANQVATQLPKASMSDDQKLAGTDVPRKAVAAVLVRLGSTWPSRSAAVQTKVQNIINNYANAIVNALS